MRLSKAIVHQSTLASMPTPGAALLLAGCCSVQIAAGNRSEGQSNRCAHSLIPGSGLRRIKMLPVVGHVHGPRETLRVRAATANVMLTLMEYKAPVLVLLLSPTEGTIR